MISANKTPCCIPDSSDPSYNLQNWFLHLSLVQPTHTVSDTAFPMLFPRCLVFLCFLFVLSNLYYTFHCSCSFRCPQTLIRSFILFMRPSPTALFISMYMCFLSVFLGTPKPPTLISKFLIRILFSQCLL